MEQMTREELVDRALQFYDQNVKLMQRKSADYSSDTDPFSNFRTGPILGIPEEYGFLTIMINKISRIATFIRNGNLKNESVNDTLQDISVYAMLLNMWIEEKLANINGKQPAGSTIPTKQVQLVISTVKKRRSAGGSKIRIHAPKKQTRKHKH